MIAGLALLAAATLAFALRDVACDALRRAASAGRGRRYDVDRRLRAHRRSLRSGGARSRDGARDGRQQPRHHHRPGLGGWLYEIGGIRLPFLFVAALAVVDLVVFALVAPRTHGSGTSAPMLRVLAHRPIAICVLVVIAGGGTIAMLEPVIPLVFRMRLGLGPGAIGTLFGMAAVASTAMHPIYGRLSDRFGGRRLMMIGLVASALLLPLLSLATDFRSAAFAMVPMWMVFSMVVTPSLAYMAEAASAAGFTSYGVVYGVYNMAWAIGLMAAPALGGFLLERIGFESLTIGWGLFLLVIGLILARIR